MSDLKKGCGFLPGESPQLIAGTRLGFWSRKTSPHRPVTIEIPEPGRGGVWPGGDVFWWNWTEETIRPGYPIFGAEPGVLVDEALRWLAAHHPHQLTFQPSTWDGVPTEVERRFAQMLLAPGYNAAGVPAENPPHSHRLQASLIVRMYADLNPTVPLPWRPSAPKPGRKPLPPPTLKPDLDAPFMSPPGDQPKSDPKTLTGRMERLEDAFRKMRLALEEFG